MVFAVPPPLLRDLPPGFGPCAAVGGRRQREDGQGHQDHDEHDELASWYSGPKDADSVRWWLARIAVDDLDKVLKAWPGLTAAYFHLVTVGLAEEFS